jgi:hypothetical protein
MLAISVTLAGCNAETGGKASATPTRAPAGTFTLLDSGCGYEGASQVAAGNLRANLSNGTADRAHFDLWKLDAGHDYTELSSYVSEAGRRLRAKEQELPHPPFGSLISSTAVASSASGVLSADLRPGVYGMACIRWKVTEEGPLDMYPAGPINVS